MTKSEEKADEILQDVFLKLWIKRATLDGIRSLKDYLFRMTKNRLLDNFKKDERHRNFLKEATSEQSNEDAMDAVILKEYHQLVRDGLKTMPERRQEIFLMNARDEMTAKEIADKLNLTTSVVKRQIFEAQQQLRKYLREHGDILMLLMLACSTINANLLS